MTVEDLRRKMRDRTPVLWMGAVGLSGHALVGWRIGSMGDRLVGDTEP